MANETEVYAFEKNWIAALESVLAIASTQTVTFGDSENHKTPRIEVSFDYGGANQVDRGLTSEGKQFLQKHNGTLSLRIYGQVKADHLDLVGQVRSVLAYNTPTLVQPALPYYQVTNVFEQAGSSDNGEEEEDFELGTTLNFDVAFYIEPRSFNNNTPLSFDDDALSFDETAIVYS